MHQMLWMGACEMHCSVCPLNSYLYIHWILDLKLILLLNAGQYRRKSDWTCDACLTQQSPPPTRSPTPPNKQISDNSTFNVPQLNANGIGNKPTELEVVLERNKVKVAVIQESKLSPKSKNLEEITAYLKDNSLLISAPKSSVTLLTPDTHQAKIHPRIFIENSHLPLDIGGLSGPPPPLSFTNPPPPLSFNKHSQYAVCGRESIR